MAALTTVALLLRLFRLDFETLWFDEAFSALTFARPFRELIEVMKLEGSAPFYHVFMHFWRMAFGDGELSLRLPSALAGAAAVPLLYAAGTRLFSARAGLFAAALAVASPLHVHFSQEARMYPLVALASLAVVVSAHRLLREPRPGTALAFAAALAFGVYLHYFFLFLTPLPGLALLAREPRRATAFAAAALALVALAFAPWLPTFLDQAGSPLADWIGDLWRERSLLWALPRSFEVLGPGARYPDYSNLELASSTPAGVASLAFAAFALGSAALRARRDPAARLVLAAALLPLLIACAVSGLRRPVYVVARYDMIAWAPYLLLAGAALARLRPLPGRAAAAVWIGLCGLALWPHFAERREAVIPADRGREIAARLLEVARPGELVIFTVGTRTVTDYYLRERPVPFARVSHPLGTDDHPGWIDVGVLNDRARARAAAERTARWAVEREPHPEAIWVVAPTGMGTPPLLAALRERGYRRSDERSRPGLRCLERMR